MDVIGILKVYNFYNRHIMGIVWQIGKIYVKFSTCLLSGGIWFFKYTSITSNVIGIVKKDLSISNKGNES